jgi:endonuclease/exonuclease/phosphatase (EEP) superfamily protein YafD
MVRWTDAPAEPTYDVDEPGDLDEPRRPRRGAVTALLALLALLFLAYGVARVIGLDDLVDLAFVAGAMALTPYVIAGCLVLAVVTFVLRRRMLALVVLVVALSLGVLLGPRVLSEEQPQATGTRLRIMAANLYVGRADARTIVNLVRQQQVDILTMPELTPLEVSALDDAGLAELLPYRVFDARPGGDGTGLAANVPLRQVIVMPETTFSQPTVKVELPGRDDIQLTAVHVQPPLYDEDVRTWRTELAGLPKAAAEDRVSILAGDFNATFDHAAFRNLIDRGYADAAEQTGNGLDATWSSLPTGPPLTLDHVVVDDRCAISSYAVYGLPGSDHNAIIAEVVLPQ